MILAAPTPVMNSMNAEAFLDTNILIYAYDQKAPARREKALSLTQADRPWVISWQVVQEFCSVALHRFPIPLDQEFLNDYLDLILTPHCKIQPSLRIFREAIRIQHQTQYRFYDSLIVAAALESGASTLYSEDLQHGRQIGHLRIVNPFL
jgi:predicted nucleic acid-binding protein